MSQFLEASVRTVETRVHYIFDVGDPEYREIVLPADGPLSSIAIRVPAAAWYERELHDQYGVEILGHPDLRPLVFHDHWPDGVYPMVDPVDDVPWAKREYRFLQVQGEGIAEVAVGPVHACIIEPGHFRFSVVGDTILHLELRHFYTHKGTEKLSEGGAAADGATLAESVSGDNCFAHAVCYSQAVENAHGIEVPAAGHGPSPDWIGAREACLPHLGRWWTEPPTWASAWPQRMRRASRSFCFGNQRSVAERATGAALRFRAASIRLSTPPR